MAGYGRTVKKLQRAINQRAGAKLLINTSQWYSKDKERTVTTFIVRQSIDAPNKPHGVQNVELFRTYSQVQLLLFLRDYWYELNGWEVPRDNEVWEEIKNNYVSTKRASDTDPSNGRGGWTSGNNC